MTSCAHSCDVLCKSAETAKPHELLAYGRCMHTSLDVAAGIESKPGFLSDLDFFLQKFTCSVLLKVC